VSIAAGCIVAADVELGDDVVLHPGVIVAARCASAPLRAALRRGAVRGGPARTRCLVHPGTVIGSDGFGFEPTAEGWEKVPQCGTVVIGDDVEIGANCAIDRGRFEATRIGNGVKIDNLVHIAHNVVVEDGALLIAQVGVAGSARIGARAILAGQVGVAGHLTIGAGARLAPQSGVAKDVPPGEDQFGSPVAREGRGFPAAGPVREAAGARPARARARAPPGRTDEEDLMRAQRTIATPVEFSGRGLHTGEQVHVRVMPAREDAGVEFVRVDVPDALPIPAHIRFYFDEGPALAPRARRLRRRHDRAPPGGVHGLQVDNLRVEMTGAEMPGLDGSAKTLADLFVQPGSSSSRARPHVPPRGSALRARRRSDARGLARRAAGADGPVHRRVQRSRRSRAARSISS
jgi:acetyltransferase-like isoleucine patch superfamily enzyme